MSKKALGRGLGELLSDRGGVTGPASVPASKPNDAGDLGPGLRVLILKNRGVATDEHSPALLRASGAVKFSLAVADAGIAGMIFVWQATSDTPMRLWEAATCVVCILLAGWLGLLAAWLHFHGD